jgi:hypothetical protein
MARADLLIDIVRAGAEGNHELFRRALEALITEERSKQHHVLADRLAAHLQLNDHSKQVAAIAPVSLNGAGVYSWKYVLSGGWEICSFQPLCRRPVRS